MLPSYLHNNVFSAPNWTFVHGFCVLVPNYVANHVVFWSNFCRESRCFGDTFRPLKKVLVTQKGFFPGLHTSIQEPSVVSKTQLSVFSVSAVNTSKISTSSATFAVICV